MRVLTGIQPSGTIHIGNYFGAMKPILDLSKQEESETFIFIADLHAMTTVNDPEILRQATLNIALDYLSLGLDPDRVTFYRQSDVVGHSDLAWILSNLAPMGLLERAHSYKDKVAKGIDANVGLFYYPILMAADILLYDVDLVPVGKDQKQHLEITRDLAQKFNSNFSEVFKLPDGLISETTAIIPGLDGQKMSKSYGNTIEVFADPKAMKKKIMSIQTDSAGVDEPKEHQGNVIYELSKFFMNEEELAQLRADFINGGVGYGDMKKRLLENVINYFAPHKAKRDELAKKPEQIEQILTKGAQKAQKIASHKLADVRKVVGL
ncbi:MAG: tryptophan--tRNA ligase [Candidatus Gracilibacteria bacterium]|jgi:tryptophanyl-tRNA synthetase|nr:tryptophan--tRNA ligase [Candidatus Gracilibacteria bacterium]